LGGAQILWGGTFVGQPVFLGVVVNVDSVVAVPGIRRCVSVGKAPIITFLMRLSIATQIKMKQSQKKNGDEGEPICEI
jgi:hypothetical protein